MAAGSPSLSFDSLRKNIRGSQLANCYLLYGEEGYFIDELLKDFVSTVPEADRDFSIVNLYASDTEPQRVVDICRSFPMMSDRQLVFLKEAQAYATRDLAKLIPYIEAPSPTTLFVISIRSKDKDFKGGELLKALKKNGGIAFESKKLTSKTLQSTIMTIANDLGVNIEPRSVSLLSEYIGTDASRLYNELEKLAFILGKGMTITPESIERNIGISKDYNVFELTDALSVKDSAKAFKIIKYFAANPKTNPITQIASSIFTYFSNVLIFHFTKDKSRGNLLKALGLRWDFQLRPIEEGAKRYNAWKAIEIIAAIRTFDAQSKGVGSRQNAYDLLYDLTYHILTAPGNLPV